jgi:hypothetical protein
VLEMIKKRLSIGLELPTFGAILLAIFTLASQITEVSAELVI